MGPATTNRNYTQATIIYPVLAFVWCYSLVKSQQTPNVKCEMWKKKRAEIQHQFHSYYFLLFNKCCTPSEWVTLLLTDQQVSFSLYTPPQKKRKKKICSIFGSNNKINSGWWLGLDISGDIGRPWSAKQIWLNIEGVDDLKVFFFRLYRREFFK